MRTGCRQVGTVTIGAARTALWILHFDGLQNVASFKTPSQDSNTSQGRHSPNRPKDEPAMLSAEEAKNSHLPWLCSRIARMDQIHLAVGQNMYPTWNGQWKHGRRLVHLKHQVFYPDSISLPYLKVSSIPTGAKWS